MEDFSPLDERAMEPAPLPLFFRWYNDAIAAQVPDAEAMVLATSAPDGCPSARVVLLRGFDERGFAFYTNYQSRKGAELAANPRAALVWFWAPLERQIRVEGRVEKVSSQDSDDYFRARPFGHRISALASPQSQVISERAFLENRMVQLTRDFLEREVARPDYWGGYRVVPHCVEFWQGRQNRLHDRLRYRRPKEGEAWIIERLAP